MVPRKVLQRWSGYSLLEGRTTQTANDDAETCCSADRATRPSRRENALVCLLVANTMLFLMTAAMLASLRRPRSTELLNQALRATSSYSPVFDMIDLEPSIRRINGTVNPAGKLSIARQFPNPEADAVWENDIELIRPIPVTREQIVKMGKNPDTVAKLENSVWGLGDDAYVAALDLFHNLHCLNALRQAIYPDYYNQSRVDTENQQSMTAIHLNHCVDILFQHISCSNNVNLVTRHWTEGREYPFPDFSINSHCINFEKLSEWHKEVSIDMKKYLEVMRKPPGVREEPAEEWHSDEWLKAYYS